MNVLRFGALCAGLFLLEACSSAASFDAMPGATMREASTSDSEVPIVVLDDFGVPRRGFAGTPSNRALSSDDAKSHFTLQADASELAASDRELANATRHLVYTGRLDLAVGDVEAVATRAREQVESWGGYLQALEGNTLVLRIPAARWDEAFETLSSLGRVTGRSLNVQDVTEEFVDVELQLGNLRALNERLVELLAKAESVEETLAVEMELSRVRGEIERLQGRLNVLTNRTTFGTLSLHLTAMSMQSPGVRRLPFAWLQELGVERLLGLGAVR